MIPNGAQAVIDAGKRGLIPAEMLIVSLVGRVNEPNHTIYANASKDYDWQWLKGVQVCVYTDQSAKWQKTLEAIAACRPAFLGLWDTERLQGAQVFRLPNPADIDKPQQVWRWVLDFLPWTPFENRSFAWN